MRWLRDEVDERLSGLFSDDAGEVGAAIQELLDQAAADDDLHEILLETFQLSLDEQNDETQGTAWMALILGELELAEALGPLLQATSYDDDEVLVLAAVRSLRRMGRPAFTAILERLDEDDDYPTGAFVAAVQVLEGVQLHSLADVRAEIEETLVAYLLRARAEHAFTEIAKVEGVAIALAHMGVARAKPTIQSIVDELPVGNSFLQEAIEIMDEHPAGMPCSASASWLEEFHWAFGEPFDEDVFGEDAGDDDDFAPDLSVTETPDERIVHIRPPQPDEDES